MSVFRFTALLAVLASVGAAPCWADNKALLAFKREQIARAEGLAQDPTSASPDLSRWLEKTRERAQFIAKATGDAAFLPPSNFHERAYFASNDGSAQPFWVALPNGYTPRRKWPLAVFLHGYSTSITKLTPAIPPAEIIRAAQAYGLILAIPYGRRNSDFVQWGQDDVLRVREEVVQNYSVDENRISLVGASMGGYGVYAAGLHNPSLWSALAPICGRSDMFLWFKTAPDLLPAWKTQLYRADDPRTLLPNARFTPIWAQHGALDSIVPVEHSRRIFADAQRLGLPFFYHEAPEGDHWGDFQFTAFDGTFDWVRQQVRKPRRQATIVSGDLREAQNGWAQITAFEDYAQIARLDVRIETEKIVVQTRNVAAFTLDVPRGFIKQPLVPLEVNGLEARLVDPLAPVNWRKSGAKLGKTPARTGPFKNLMRDRFLLVYGNEKDRADAEKFAMEWKLSADGAATILAASDIGESEKATANLILFGDETSNPLVAQLGELPVQRREETQGLRLVLPSPWHKSRLVGVCQGAWWGEKLPLNHKWDLLPDYIVYEGEKYENDDTNAATEAGFLNGDWKRD